jgi:hypothetical protein
MHQCSFDNLVHPLKTKRENEKKEYRLNRLDSIYLMLLRISQVLERKNVALIISAFEQGMRDAKNILKILNKYALISKNF